MSVPDRQLPSRQRLYNARVLLPGGELAPREVIIDGGRIAAVEGPAAAAAGCAGVDLGGAILAPGFIDTQVNGGGDVLFNDRPDVEAIRAIGAAHRRCGTTGFLPTIISDDLEVVARAIDAAQRALDEGVPGVLGIHVEGPFISVAKRGVHAGRYLRQLDAAQLPLLKALRGGRTLVTLAPEAASPGLIAALDRAGVIVAGGHSNAGHGQVRAAMDAGMRAFTHLFNAMSALQAREPGMVGAALHDPAAWCCIIVDGQHVHPVTLQLALRCKPAAGFVLVTDAMPPVGGQRDWFMLQGQRVRVVDGACRDEAGGLAGTALDMASAVRNAVRMLGVAPGQALCMAAENPARMLGLQDEVGLIAPGRRANLVLLDDSLQVTRTWIDGVAL
jgi:N-acetylglucosamine-6-phosphate deacetylase